MRSGESSPPGAATPRASGPETAGIAQRETRLPPRPDAVWIPPESVSAPTPGATYGPPNAGSAGASPDPPVPPALRSPHVGSSPRQPPASCPPRPRCRAPHRPSVCRVGSSWLPPGSRNGGGPGQRSARRALPAADAALSSRGASGQRLATSRKPGLNPPGDARPCRTASLRGGCRGPPVRPGFGPRRRNPVAGALPLAPGRASR